MTINKCIDFIVFFIIKTEENISLPSKLHTQIDGLS